MDLNSRIQGNITILAPRGRVDHASAEFFSAALKPHLAECKTGGMPLVLDFSGIEYISSVGLRALMLAARQAKAQNGRIAIAALAPMVKEVFEISRFNLVYRVFDQVDEAVAGLSS
jgi:anti-anti-sigma factor